MARDKDKRQYFFKETMRGFRATGDGRIVPKDSPEVYTYQGQMANQDTGTTGSNKPTVQSNSAVWKAYVKGGGDWHGRGAAAVDTALAAAYREVQRRKRPADDACDKVRDQEAVVIACYTELVQQFAADMECSPNLERSVSRVISDLERRASRSFDELKRRDRIRLEKRSDHDASEVFYEWLKTQKSGIDPDAWAERRRAVIDAQKERGEVAKKERVDAEKALPRLERQLKDAWRDRVRAEEQLYKLEQQLDDPHASESQKGSLQRQADNLRKTIAEKHGKAKELMPQVIEAKKRQVHGMVREVHLSIANRLKSKDFDLTA